MFRKPAVSFIEVALGRASFALLGVAFALLLAGGAPTPTQASPTAQTPPAASATPLKPILLTDPVPDPHQEGIEWFAPTGHTLRGAFLKYWQQYGGLAQFGYPLTEEFFEPVGPDNKPVQVQYFERNRFELHPENAGTQYEVLLGTPGRDFRAQDPPATQQPAPARYFPETGHNLSGAFKQYWETHGGLFVHGYPITEPAQEKNPTNGKEYTVQYFERSRFETHPENAGTPYEVLLGLLGRQLSEKKGYPYGWYPQYGRAADWSWVAGYYRHDPRKCRDCGCQTVYFVDPNLQTYQGVAEVKPFGVDWLRILEQKKLIATIRPEMFIVVFGHPGNPNGIGTDQATESCLAPLYSVTEIKSNSMNGPPHEQIAYRGF